jgi:uncharacterized Fe-S cluster protein YjdI
MQKEYTNGETTVVWQAEKCVHSGICLMGLPKVFNLKARPWVNMEGASTEGIEAAVAKCPSGALTIKGKDNLRKELIAEKEASGEATEVTVVRGGPVIVSGRVAIKNPKGRVWKEMEDAAFCRCGKSQDLPFCDGSHVKH